VPGDADLLIAARAALLDALQALVDQRDALVLIGAQAIYLHTGAAEVALAEATKDSDLAVDPRVLADEPLLDEAMRRAGFHRDVLHPQPGSWLSPRGIPVDLMVPAALAGRGGRRGARIPPHHRHATRRTAGLEAAMVDHAPMRIEALDPADARSATVAVAGPAALLVAKLHKLGERQDTAKRLVDKDAHDVYRLLVATGTAELADRLAILSADELASEPTRAAVVYLRQLFSSGGDAAGATMAGRAEELAGAPAVVVAAVTALADDLLAAMSATGE
jgi:nucleotidyltransferase-like protein